MIHFQPPDGFAFFGPVISRLPTSDPAVELWDEVGAQEDWRGGSRRQPDPEGPGNDASERNAGHAGCRTTFSAELAAAFLKTS